MLCEIAPGDGVYSHNLTRLKFAMLVRVASDVPLVMCVSLEHIESKHKEVLHGGYLRRVDRERR